MIRMSVMYPATPGSTFDWDYYLFKHITLLRQKMKGNGMLKFEVDRGVGSFPPGTPTRYHAIAHLFFESPAVMEDAMSAVGPELMADIPHYYSGEVVTQVSAVIEQ
jgi:uncharacterized protein (TIGR02118 family)